MRHKTITRASIRTASGGMLLTALWVAAEPVLADEAQLSWTIPTQRGDGRALTQAELAGYEVYYSSGDSKVLGVVRVNGGANASANFGNLAPATYYFTVAAIDTAGLKSPMSGMVSRQITNSTTASSTAGASVSLSWSAPTARVNGSPLSTSQLAGYELRYTGGTPSATRVVQIIGGTATSYVVSNLTPGSYQFTLSAIDTAGLKSVVSSAVSKTISQPSTTSTSSTTGGAVASGSGTSGGTTTGTGTGGTGTSTGSTGGSTGGTGTSTTSSSGSSSGGSTTTTSTTRYKVQLNWDIPSQRENGKPLQLSELSGYEIYYTTDGSPARTGTIRVTGGSTAGTTLANLAAGQYYFSISAVDTAGLKSALSTVIPAKFGP